MSTIFPAGSAALLVLSQSNLSPAAGRASAADPVLAAVHGLSGPAAEGTDNSMLARARITEALFSVNSLDPTRMKMNLYERLGKELGLSIDDFESLPAFGDAIREAVEKIRQEPDGMSRIAEISRSVGLDALGVSIDQVIEAMIDPDGAADDAIEKALLDKTTKEQEEALERLRSLAADDVGIYGPRWASAL